MSPRTISELETPALLLEYGRMTNTIALTVLTSVIGHQREKGWTLVDAGWMAMSRDRGTAEQPVDQGPAFLALMSDHGGEDRERDVIGHAAVFQQKCRGFEFADRAGAHGRRLCGLADSSQKQRL